MSLVSPRTLQSVNNALDPRISKEQAISEEMVLFAEVGQGRDI